ADDAVARHRAIDRRAERGRAGRELRDGLAARRAPRTSLRRIPRRPLVSVPDGQAVALRLELPGQRLPVGAGLEEEATPRRALDRAAIDPVGVDGAARRALVPVAR